MFGEGVQRVVVTRSGAEVQFASRIRQRSKVAWDVRAPSPGPSREVSPGPNGQVLELESGESGGSGES